MLKKSLLFVSLSLCLAVQTADARGGRNRGPWLGDRSREQLIEILVSHSEARYRSEAAHELGVWGMYKGDRGSYDALIKAFHEDAETKVRVAAARSLSSRQEADAFPVLLAALEAEGSHPDMLSALAWTICGFQDRRAIPALMKALEKKSLRFEAAHCLGELKATEAVEPLVAIILDNILHDDDGRDFVDSNAELVEGVEALGKIGDVKGLRGILPMLAEHRTSYQRQAAVRALGAIGAEPGTPAELRGELIMPALLGHLDPAGEKKLDVRVASVHALSDIDDPRVVPSLRKSFENDPSYRVRSAAADALTRMRAPGGPFNVFRDIEERLKKGLWDTPDAPPAD